MSKARVETALNVVLNDGEINSLLRSATTTTARREIIRRRFPEAGQWPAEHKTEFLLGIQAKGFDLGVCSYLSLSEIGVRRCHLDGGNETNCNGLPVDCEARRAAQHPVSINISPQLAYA